MFIHGNNLKVFKKVYFIAAALLACFMNNNTFGSTCIDDLPLIEKSSVPTSSATTNHFDKNKTYNVNVIKCSATHKINFLYLFLDKIDFFKL